MSKSLSLFKNKLMIAVSAPSKHGKTESTQMLIDLLFLEFVTRRKGWKAEIFDRKSKSFSPYTLTTSRSKDIFVVFSYKNERKIAIITSGDNWAGSVVDCYQKLVEPKDIRNSTCPKVIQASYELVVGCCHPNNNVKGKLIEIATYSGYEMMETSPYYQNSCVTSVSSKTPIFIWNYLFAKDLMEIVLERIGNVGKTTLGKVNSFSAQFTPLVFAMMEDFRKSQGGFGFDIRKTNRKGRKEQGLIFYENDDYIRVSLSNESSEAMRSSTLGLVFVYDNDTSQVDCFLEVVCDNDSKNLGWYKSLVASIAPLIDWKQVNCKDRYLMQLSFCKTADWLEAIVETRRFLEVHTKEFKDNVCGVLYR